VCDRLVLIDKGQIISQGDPQDVIKAYYDNIQVDKE
jgi:ABC-type polysaccharide/polyol phosphate transport system ATPase subunit